ncbi:MAG: universal stress protein [Blastocatellia bacterium]
MLLPIKKILCPTDFSDPSHEALRQAVELCSHFGAELCMVHVLPEIPRPGWVEGVDVVPDAEAEIAGYEEELHRGAQQKLHDLIQQRVPKELKKSAIVTQGDAACEIARVAEDERSGLIVMATHGLTGLRQVRLGSVAERVVRLSERPVLTIRASGERR